MQVEDTIESRDLAVKVLDRACMTPLLEHQVLRGCRVQAACAANAHVLPLYAVLQVRARSTPALPKRAPVTFDARPGARGLGRRAAGQAVHQ